MFNWPYRGYVEKHKEVLIWRSIPASAIIKVLSYDDLHSLNCQGYIITGFSRAFHGVFDWACNANDLELLERALKTSTRTILNLKYNSIGGDGAKALAEALKINSAPATLNLHYNQIRDDGAKALSEALKTRSTLTTLDLSDNSIGHKGSRALAEALKTNKTLTILYLYSIAIGHSGDTALIELGTNNNSIGDDGAKALTEALKTNSTLIIVRSDTFKDTVDTIRRVKRSRESRRSRWRVQKTSP
ncbi:hypothetical protein BGZ67_007894 [Mortierella alpina]|nr:hypothetical protein BGZ67_007894 [Mortierella alpina]